ncbi:Holliday junction branch migration protein RuvA [Lutispora thermophila]|uniref:Holliday junction branch migration complex subunit RuvA n=1 Tax=Lutispora thermophila DSM 19022 TaxID=1122184 RepID=A0A1M6HPU0_9FIRM|nr:Holliday junction branch migration protein RuvA [Lutispora thermophila]SHJ24235.1 Holliday junction DNA helicase subunit RuvA [Lutispora thermophila DSM 19022]
MFDYLNGVVAETGEGFIVIDIGGIGYKVFSSSNTILHVKNVSKVKLYTHLHVKEDDIVLYGFLSKNELDLFKLLISVTSVGPKAALAIMSCLKPNDLIIAIQTKNIKALTQAPGIGKKIAERIILELRDKICIDTDVMLNNDEKVTSSMSEVIEALVSLGYSYNEAALAFSKIENKEKSIDNLIKEALKQLSRI